MTIYDIYGAQHHASICVQEDGEKVWTFDRANRFQKPKDL